MIVKKKFFGFLLMICLCCSMIPTKVFANEGIQISVKPLTGKDITLVVKPTYKIEKIKKLIYEKKKIMPEKQKMTFIGKELEDNKTLQDYSIQNNSTLNLYLKTNQPSGKGTESNPYQITSKDELIWFAEQVNDGQNDICAKLMNDIDLNDVVWTPIGNNTTPYKGTFDGQEVTLSGLNGQGEDDYQGLFGYCKNATIKNIVTTNGNVKGHDDVGGIAGYAEETHIINCVNGNTISSNGNNNGGIVGYCSNTKIINCINNGNILAGRYINGGIAGYAENSTIDCCVNYGNINNTDHSGGIAAYNTNGTVSNCLNVGNIMTIGTWYCYTAGIVANNRGTSSVVKNCLNLGMLTGTNGGGCRVNSIICANDKNGTYAENCYSKEGLSHLGLANNSKTVTEEELKSGEVAWKLNEEKKGAWKQNIGINTYPTFSGNPVYKLGDGTFGSICDHVLSINHPTCTESVICSVCNAEISATGHNYEEEWLSNDTKHWHECKNCGSMGDEAEHTWKWIIDKEATDTEKGLKHEQCTVCGYKKKGVEIPTIETNIHPDKPSTNKGNVKTDDTTNFGLYTSILVTSGLLVAILIVLKKKMLNHK